MTPEKKSEVVAAYRSKKFRTSADLAKATGVSRSAVYRLLKTMDREEPESDTESVQSASEPEQAPRRNIGDDFYHKTEKFADDIGLPPDGSKLRQNVQEYSAEELAQKEAELDMAFDRIAGSTGVSVSAEIPSALMDKILGTPPTNTIVSQDTFSPTTMEPVYDQPAAAQDYIQRIIFNVEHFGAHLQIIIGPSKEVFIQNLATLSTPALKSLLTTMERTRSVGNLTSGFKQVFYMASHATEMTSSMLGIKAQGFSQQLKAQDEEITMILKEIAINEWERLKNLDSPAARLGILFSITLLQTDAQNRTQEHLRKVVNHPVNPSVAAANEDL
jgi:hypothetical protein